MIRLETKAPAMAARSNAAVKTGEVIAPFDYKVLPRDQAKMAKDAAEFIESRHRNLSAAVLEIGQKLIDVKATLGHGHFGAWVQSEFTMTIRTAQSYMSAAAGVGAKSEIVSHLPVMTLLEVAKSPDPIRAKVLEKMESAHNVDARLAVDAVKEALHEARADQKIAEREAKLSPAQKKRAAEERKKERAEFEASRIKRRKAEADAERTTVRLAELLKDRLGDDVTEAAKLLGQANVPASALAYRLTKGVYGRSSRFLDGRPQTEEEWTEMVGLLDAGENPYR